MNSTPLTIRDHGNAIMLSESIELMASGLREAFLDHGLPSADYLTKIDLEGLPLHK